MDALLELSRNPSWPSDSEMTHSSVGMRSGASVFEPPLQLFLFSSQIQPPGGPGFDAIFSIAAICNAERVTLLSSSNQITIRLLAGFIPA
jgi:hypothetical protein